MCCRQKKAFQRCSTLPLSTNIHARDDQICAYNSAIITPFKYMIEAIMTYVVSSRSQKRHPSLQLNIEVLMPIISLKHSEKHCLERVRRLNRQQEHCNHLI